MFSFVAIQNDVYIVDPGHEECPSPLDGELHADNNANSTYSEPSTREESPVSSFVHFILCLCMIDQDSKAPRWRDRHC